MAQQISRLRYFDGEYLGAGDLTAEQTYHLSMRRSLTRYLHLYGIVEGLNLTSDPTAPVNSFAARNAATTCTPPRPTRTPDCTNR